jgi:hypothetical protein
MDSSESPEVRTPLAGDNVVVSRRGGLAGNREGIFVGQRGFTISLRLEGNAFADGEDVLMACGPVGFRAAALARAVGEEGGIARFTRLSAWRAVDTREHPRYRTQLRATIRRTSGNVHGNVLDISRGGAAIAVSELPGGNRLEVRVGTSHKAPLLPCRVVSFTDSEAQTVLHLRFEELAPPAVAYVDQLVAEVCSAMEPGLLAS